MFAVVLAGMEDPLKLLLLIIFGGGLLAFGRWSSRLGSSTRQDSPLDIPTPDVAGLVPLGGDRCERAASVSRRSCRFTPLRSCPGQPTHPKVLLQQGRRNPRAG